MKTVNDSDEESNNSNKNVNIKNSLGHFPLLKFNENLYNSCQSKYCDFLNNRKTDIKLIINNKINQQISLDDYISNSDCNELTPIPFISKRRIKNNQEKKELKNFQRNVVLMRRLEYSCKMKEKKLKQKYNNKIPKIIYLQKVIRGYLVRKIIKQINLIKNTLTNFTYLIELCIRKKYYFILKKEISKIKKETSKKSDKIYKKENIPFDNNNNNLNGNEEKTIKNDFYNGIIEQFQKTNGDIIIEKEDINNDNKNNYDIESKDLNENEENNKKELIKQFNDKKMSINSNSKSDKNINIAYKKNKQNKYNPCNFQSIGKKQDSIIENDYYIDFSNKDSQQNESKMSKVNNINNINSINSMNNINSIINKINNINNMNSKKKIPNRNPKNDNLNYYLSDISSFLEIKKTKTEIIQKQFRKYLSKKGYYGKFDKRKIVIIYLLKNIIINNIRPYVLNIILLINKQIRSMTKTQEENYFNLSSERVNIIDNIYKAAKSEII